MEIREKPAGAVRRPGGTLLDLLFPRKCAFCGHLLRGEEAGYCAACARSLPWERQAEAGGEFLGRCLAPLRYEGAVKKSVQRFKFHGRSAPAETFAALMAACLAAHGGQYDLVTWVPTTRRRLRRRGYDQSALLAHAVAARLGLPVRAALVRTGETAPQSALTTREARRANVLGAFAALPEAGLAGQRVLLVDDVVTTGATLSECARVLRTSLAQSVDALVLARRSPHAASPRGGPEI